MEVPNPKHTSKRWGRFAAAVAAWIISLVFLRMGIHEFNQTSSSESVANTETALERARQLVPPIAQASEGGEYEGSEWWLEHDELLQAAWKEWNEVTDYIAVPQLGRLSPHYMIDSTLFEAMNRTKETATAALDETAVEQHEASVRNAWEEVLLSSHSFEQGNSKLTNRRNQGGRRKEEHYHRVYRCQGFLTPKGIKALRRHLSAVSDKSGIPLRRPNAMNRNGLLLDPNIPGGVAGDPELQRFIPLLAKEYLRPLGRSLFPEFAGNPQDDANHYAFTIQYGAPNTTKTTNMTMDKDLKEHSDASLYTLNINLNLPTEDYSGSSLYFVVPTDSHYNETSNHYQEVSFEPGTAILHRGMTKHGARPLQEGQRNNLVIWVHGEGGYVRVAPYPEDEQMTARERWSNDAVTTTAKDGGNPFGGFGGFEVDL